MQASALPLTIPPTWFFLHLFGHQNLDQPFTNSFFCLVLFFHFYLNSPYIKHQWIKWSNKIQRLIRKLTVNFSHFFKKLFDECGCFACMHAFALHACLGPTGKKREPEPLELNLQMVLSHHVHMGRSNPESSARASGTYNTKPLLQTQINHTWTKSNKACTNSGLVQD